VAKVTKPTERIAFLREEFKAAKRQITEEAARALLDAVGNELRELAAAASQLIADTAEDGKAPIDETVVASEIHSYKPNLMHWLEFYARTLADKRAHVHVGASNFHDIGPASKLRIRSVWVNRLNEHAITDPTIEIEDLYELGQVLDDLIPET